MTKSTKKICLTGYMEIKNLGNSEVEIVGEISTEKFEKWRERAVKNISSSAEIPGFRRGMAPEKVIVQKFGEMAVLEEMAELALAAAYSEILEKNNINAIGRPQVSITKIAKNSPLGFKLKTAVVPEVSLPDYKKIAGEVAEKKEDVVIPDEEVSKVIDGIRRKREGGDETPLAPLTDEMAKSLGDFNGVDDLKTKIRENLVAEKEWRGKQKKRASIAEKIIEKTEATLPKVLIDQELEKMLAQFKGDVANMGLKFEDYLVQLKKSESEIKKDWQKDAEKRVKLEIILVKIASVEKIFPSKEEIEKEAGHILEHYKDADKERTLAYAESLLTKEKVFEFLENAGLAAK